MAYNLNGITDISDFINYGKGLIKSLISVIPFKL